VVVVWDLTTRRAKYTLKEHAGAVRCVAYSPDGSRIASASEDGTLNIWDAPRGAAVRTTRVGLRPVLAYAPNGKRLAVASLQPETGSWRVSYLDATSGEELPDAPRGLAGSVEWLSFTADGRGLVTAGGNERFAELKLWNTDNGEELSTLEGHPGLLLKVALSADGRRLATVDNHHAVRVWDADRARPSRAFLRAYSLRTAAFSGDGGLLALGGMSGLHVWDGVGVREREGWEDFANRVNHVAFPAAGGLLLASADDDGGVWVWDAATGQELLRLDAGVQKVRCLAVHPGGQSVAFGGARNTVTVWGLRGGAVLCRLEGHQAAVSGVAFSPDGRRLATAGQNRTVRLWQADTGRPLTSLEGESPFVDVVFSPDGKWLAAGSQDGSVRLWEASAPAAGAVLTGHTGPVRSLAFDRTGRRLATGSGDHTVKIWDLAIGAELLTLHEHTGAVTGVAFSPDGDRLVSVSEDGAARVWEAAPAVPGTAPAQGMPEGTGAEGVPVTVSPADQADARRRRRVIRNLKRIVRAIIDCAARHQGRMPAAVIPDAAGNPLASWRIATLPYLGEENLFKQFRLEEAWDSPHNLRLLDKMPDVFALEPGQKGSATVFQLFVGDNTLFPGTRQSVYPASITDGTSNTILVAEAGEAVSWTKPADLPYDANRPLPRLGGAFPDGFYVGLADGTVRFLRKDMSEKTIRLAITPADGTPMGPEW
jgi:WD40 repeat protein